MDLKDFDINEFMYELEPFLREKSNTDSADSTRKSISKLLSLFEENSGHVFEYFPLLEYDKNDIGKFLKLVLNNKELKRESVSLINKISVDRNLESWVLKDMDQEKETARILETIPGYVPLAIGDEVRQVRVFIRQSPGNVDCTLSELLEFNKDIYNAIFTERQMFRVIGLGLKVYSYITEYMEYVSDGILQFINYCIIANDNIQSDKKLHIMSGVCDKILELDKFIEYQTYRSKLSRANKPIQESLINLSIEEATDFFIRYISKKNEYGEYLLILKELNQEEADEPELFKEVMPEYIALKEACNIEESEKIITEGKTVREYSRKLDEVREMIDIFSIYGGRDINSWSIQDIKVHFREIFISKSKYKRRAMSIAREYLEICKTTEEIKAFEKGSEYMFLREKISRGYFREKNLLSFYHKKNEVQELLYNLLIKTHLLYDYDDMLRVIFEINETILQEMLKKYRV